MPELPEVETYTRYFAKHALDQRIARVEVIDERILGEIRKDAFVKGLKGRTFTSVRRHGKHLFADAGGRWLHLHFGMTGDLAYLQADQPNPRFSKVVFQFDGGAKLAFEDMRLFGLVDLIDDADALIGKLGPDPLGLKPSDFRAILERRRGAVKSLLMTQEILAGVGNLYADEALYQASIHPRRAIDKLKPKEIDTLFTTLRRILRQSITRHEKGSELPGNWLFQHREEGDRCPRCGGTIQRTVVFGRTTYFCAAHQR